MKNIYKLAAMYLGLGLIIVSIIAGIMANEGTSKPIAYSLICVIGVAVGGSFYITAKSIKRK